MSLSDEDRRRIYEEEKARFEAQEQVKREKRQRLLSTLLWNRIRQVVAFVVVGVIVLAVIGSLLSDDEDEESVPGIVFEDLRLGAGACGHWLDTSRDWDGGILTTEEYRDELKKVHTLASGAKPAIQQAARDILSSITAEDIPEYVEGTLAMRAACIDAGYLVDTGESATE